MNANSVPIPNFNINITVKIFQKVISFFFFFEDLY